MSAQQTLADRGMAAGLRALNRFASSSMVDRLGLREPAEAVPAHDRQDHYAHGSERRADF